MSDPEKLERMRLLAKEGNLTIGTLKQGSTIGQKQAETHQIKQNGQLSYEDVKNGRICRATSLQCANEMAKTVITGLGAEGKLKDMDTLKVAGLFRSIKVAEFRHNMGLLQEDMKDEDIPF